jgi:Golgi SNAP receptor complex protein 2
MTSIVELFPKCRKLAYDARQHLAQAQHGTVSVTELYMVLEELGRQLDCMEELVVRETPAQRDVWKRKITELRQECASLQKSGEATAAYSSRQQQQQQRNGNAYGNERDELMLRRRKRRGGDESDLGNLADESGSLQQSHNMVGDLLASGQASLTGLVDQRQRLRGVKRVLVDIGSRLGLSQSTMRIIERRDITDAYLVAAGMVVTCLVIYFVWF